MNNHGSQQVAGQRPARLVIALMTAVFTAAATATYWVVVAGGTGVNVAEAISIPLFSCLFAWITFSFFVAMFGWNSWRKSLRTKAVASQMPSIRGATANGSTAVLMPIYNENPANVFSGVAAMVRSLRSLGRETEFDFYILSDTTNAETWLEEEAEWAKLTAELGDDCRVFYRHRPLNRARKSGNIADFCCRWGTSYQYMIVLDADSLVSGQTMSEMVRRMDADPKVGILQVPPLPIGRKSLFARMQQFGAHLYGPVFCEGFVRWAGDDGNYWGHNAIIRTEPFMQHCDLPVLPGSAPLGGEIMSHDFVEAALMLRAGWKVKLATDLGGSFEECPTTLADYAQRDQRWCQGNLQHCRLIIAERFKPLSRWHFFSGVLSYAAAPLWVLFTVFCVLGIAVDALAGDTEAIGRQTYPIALLLFGASLSLLLAPKIATVLTLMLYPKQASKFGGRWRLLGSAILEGILSTVLSPIMAIFHSRFVLTALLGKSVRWSAQQRNEHGVRWVESARQFASMTLIGIAMTVSLAYTFPELLIWFAPISIGLLLSIPLGVAMGSVPLGEALRKRRLLSNPEEKSPSIVKRYYDLELATRQDNAAKQAAHSRFHQVIRDPEFYSLHASIQKASEADVAMSADQLAELETVRRDQGVAGIPEPFRKAILLDADVLRQLHVAEQCVVQH